jgi:hypothetical protein
MADAKECRMRALRCAELAQSKKCGRLRELLLDLTKTWLKVACELERTDALLDDEFLELGFCERNLMSAVNVSQRTN